QFFTPREVIRAMVKVVDPQVGETVYDPACGTGGFLAQSYEYMLNRLGDDATAEQLETLKQWTFYGREKENLIFPIALANLVLDEGVLFRTNETAFVQTKRKLLDDCDLWCIISLPAGVFTQAGAGVKTNLAFFTRGGPTERVWYYDLSDIKVTKKQPFTISYL